MVAVIGNRQRSSVLLQGPWFLRVGVSWGEPLGNPHAVESSAKSIGVPGAKVLRLLAIFGFW